MANGLRVRDGGTGQPVLLLLHGMGATGDVWRHWAPPLARRWPGRWIAPDLPGHGGSEPLPRYSFGGVAARVAELVAGEPRVVVLGHSFGGAVGLALASGWFGVPVEAAIGLGIKVFWTDDELAKARALAARQVGWFDS
ncbi:MAG: alpha/beta fold hydrolase, partial [Actinophytocola sp.]|nr:alpha/beta fold hydrolase [Actinophytocola sp.]